MPLPKLLCAKFGQVLPINNWDMAQNVICKDHDHERSRSYIKKNGTIGFLDLKNIDLDTKIVILSALVQKL